VTTSSAPDRAGDERSGGETAPATSTEPRLSAHDRRTGTLAGVAAYSLWGLFPLVFHQLESVDAQEILLHRVLWSLVVVALILLVRRDKRWFDHVRSRPGALPRLVVASLLIATNWLVYIWAVNHDNVVQAALGYYINPLITVALGVVVLHERLRRMQVVALVFGAAAVAVLTASYGNVPWIALTLACSFAGYGFLKKSAGVDAVPALAVETASLAPAALVWLVVLEADGSAAFLHGSSGRDVLLVSLGVVTAVPLLLFGTAANRIPLSLLGLLQYLTPTLQLLCGVVVLGEPLPPDRLAGFVLVWIALIVLTWDGMASRRRELALEAATVI
jgi:chloramphenicol-sensitive protein RarD